MSYNHLIEIDELNRELFIYRVYPTGMKELYTQVKLPDSANQDKQVFNNFCLQLGENILIDSSVARKLLQI